MQLMAAHPLLRDPKKVQAFPLHSSLPPDAQRSVFKKMPPGVRKVRHHPSSLLPLPRLVPRSLVLVTAIR